VWLSIKNLKTDRPSKKLDYKIISLFKIIKAFGNIYTLNLPAHIKIHPIFHVFLLRKNPADLLPGQYQDPPPLIKINGHNKYKVNDILAARLFGRVKRL
jgi:hypothetical protein